MFIELGEIIIGKRQKGRPIIELLVILPPFKRFTSRYSSFGSFYRRLLAVEQGIFGCPGRI